MKKNLLILICCAFVAYAQAQLPDGSYAPNFSLYEIDKTTGVLLTDSAYTLHQYTDAGKTVFLDFFGYNCVPCWNYHQSGAFEDLYEQYGPDGTDEVMTFGIETVSNSYDNLISPRNWLDGVPYPILPANIQPNTTDPVAENYAISILPTIYMVCPTRQVYQLQLPTVAVMHNAINTKCPSYEAGLLNNGYLITCSGFEDIYICEHTAYPKVMLQNLGELTLTTATLTIDLDGQTSTFNWTGSLDKFHAEEVSLPELNLNTNGQHTYTVAIESVNGVPDADPSGNTYTKTFNVQVEGTTEPFEEDFTDDSFLDSWTITSNGIPDIFFNWFPELYQGIGEYAGRIGIYPNPARSRLYINSSAQVESVEVYNLQGQLVGMENGNVHSVAVGGFAPGVYIVRITTTDGILNQRFVKE